MLDERDTKSPPGLRGILGRTRVTMRAMERIGDGPTNDDCLDAQSCPSGSRVGPKATSTLMDADGESTATHHLIRLPTRLVTRRHSHRLRERHRHQRGDLRDERGWVECHPSDDQPRRRRASVLVAGWRNNRVRQRSAPQLGRVPDEPGRNGSAKADTKRGAGRESGLVTGWEPSRVREPTAIGTCTRSPPTAPSSIASPPARLSTGPQRGHLMERRSRSRSRTTPTGEKTSRCSTWRLR
jgi:hypothetical protein